MTELKPSSVIVGTLTSIVVLSVLVLVGNYLDIPSDLLGSLGLTLCFAIFTFTKYSSFLYPQKVLLVGLMTASLVIFFLSVIKHYFIDFDFNLLHIAGIMSIPFILHHYLERRVRRRTSIGT